MKAAQKEERLELLQRVRGLQEQVSELEYVKAAAVLEMREAKRRQLQEERRQQRRGEQVGALHEQELEEVRAEMEKEVRMHEANRMPDEQGHIAIGKYEADVVGQTPGNLPKRVRKIEKDNLRQTERDNQGARLGVPVGQGGPL